MNPRAVQIVAVLAFAGLLYAAATFAPAINEGRRELNMIGTENPLASAPPEYAFAIQAFGAFRGILTNVAFIRAEQYKMDGRYYDAMQLADWITKLQPRFPSVWEFQSWNMAWNISVTTYTPEERWNWVYNGARLIRDQGLRYNERAVNLYRQLAWIYVNKMSETTDDHHMTYKRNWAWRMHVLLGAPPDPLRDYNPAAPFAAADENATESLFAKVAGLAPPEPPEPGAAPTTPAEAAPATQPLDVGEIAKAAIHDWLMQIAAAPDKLSGLYAAEPAARAIVDALASELDVRISDDTLTEDEYWRDQGLAITFFDRVRRLTDAPSMRSRLARSLSEDADAQRRARFDEIVGVSSRSPAGQALLRFLQKKVLLEVYRMRPARMAELVAAFGPIDWRSVDATALYWVNEGLIAGRETLQQFSNDKTNTARLLFFALRNLYLRNRITFEPWPENINASYLALNPDFNFVEAMHQAYVRFGPLLDPYEEKKPGAGETFRTGHINFLSESIRMLYFAGREREARRYYDYLRDTYGRNDAGQMNPEFAPALYDFVMNTFRETFSTREITYAINGLLMQSFNELSQGNLAQYNLAVGVAQDLWRNYHTEDRAEKIRLPAFREMQADVLRGWLAQPSIVSDVTIQKARTWSYLPLYLRHAVYDDLITGLTAECQAQEFDVATAFPEPIGLAEYRARTGRRGPDDKDKPVNTPAQQFE